MVFVSTIFLFKNFCFRFFKFMLDKFAAIHAEAPEFKEVF